MHQMAALEAWKHLKRCHSSSTTAMMHTNPSNPCKEPLKLELDASCDFNASRTTGEVARTATCSCREAVGAKLWSRAPLGRCPPADGQESPTPRSSERGPCTEPSAKAWPVVVGPQRATSYWAECQILMFMRPFGPLIRGVTYEILSHWLLHGFMLYTKLPGDMLWDSGSPCAWKTVVQHGAWYLGQTRTSMIRSASFQQGECSA